MAAAKSLMLRRNDARVILDRLAASKITDDRYDTALALLDIARIAPDAVPPDLVER
jgi:hypothetical protein